MRQKSILPHALTMVWRERRSYALLSVTVVLSLALLLGYMLFTDSRLYNRYRFVMAQDSSLVEVEFLGQQNREQMEQYVENAARLGEIRDQRWHYTCLGMGLNLQAADEMGEPETAILSSIDTFDGVDRFESHLTTPEAMVLRKNIDNAVGSGISHLILTKQAYRSI